MTTTARSKDIRTYFKATLGQIRPDRPITFDIHLYFRRNGHIIVLRKQGETLTKEFIGRYTSRGIQEIWIHKDDAEAFRKYVSLQLEKAEDPDFQIKVVGGEKKEETKLHQKILPEKEKPGIHQHLTPEKKEEQDLHVTLPQAKEEKGMHITLSHPSSQTKSAAPKQKIVDRRSTASQKLVQLLNDDSIDPKKKAALAAKVARFVLKQTWEAQEWEAQLEVHTAAQSIVKDLLKQIHSVSASLISAIWSTPEIDAQLAHSTNVATYSVLLAISFGKIDRELISDIALAGLLHDVGLSQISAELNSKPWKLYTAALWEEYLKHTQEGLEIINAFGPSEISDRVKTLIENHHQPHPNSMDEDPAAIESASQLLRVAEWMDSVSCGQWDGVQRTYRASLDQMGMIQKTHATQVQFNPELLTVLQRWTSPDAKEDAA